ncbi:MAG: hypothetical protein BJ554DRAFT_5209 [Olpidium bornovanus]|uniref:Uncharacterized protein n=1 Tax=Olpidium bornovanus TaxID=278681 RepID=A0A8H7ZLN2_9FUNG|nr:MAG: hypothetical protein BJ554DRAFT_5209 [Olpidium bornovanus]
MRKGRNQTHVLLAPHRCRGRALRHPPRESGTLCDDSELRLRDSETSGGNIPKISRLQRFARRHDVCGKHTAVDFHVGDGLPLVYRNEPPAVTFPAADVDNELLPADFLRKPSQSVEREFFRRKQPRGHDHLKGTGGTGTSFYRGVPAPRIVHEGTSPARECAPCRLVVPSAQLDQVAAGEPVPTVEVRVVLRRERRNEVRGARGVSREGAAHDLLYLALVQVDAGAEAGPFAGGRGQAFEKMDVDSGNPT